MEQVTEDATAQVVETPSAKRVLTPEQFDKLVAGIEAKQLASGTDLSLYDWAIENVELTPDQLERMNAANNIINDQNFVL